MLLLLADIVAKEESFRAWTFGIREHMIACHVEALGKFKALAPFLLCLAPRPCDNIDSDEGVRDELTDAFYARLEKRGVVAAVH